MADVSKYVREFESYGGGTSKNALDLVYADICQQ